MSTRTQSPPSGSVKGQPRPSWLLVLLVGVVAGAIGLGAGYLVFAPQQAAGEVEVQTQALLDEFWDAADAGDADAVLALMAPTGEFFGYSVGSTSETVLRNFAEDWADVEGPKPIGEPIVVGEYGVHDIAQRGSIDGFEFLFYFNFADYQGTNGYKIGYVDTGEGIRN